MSNKMVIPAEAHTDDRVVEVTFDAVRWFEQAADEEIADLIREDFGPGYASDAVAQFFADDGPECPTCKHTPSGPTADVFAHCARMSGRRDAVGYSCVVSDDEARAWIKANRPTLLTAEDE